MTILTQNKKILIAALTIFLMSFSIMLFFLDGYKLELDNTHTNVLESSHHGDSHDNDHENLNHPVEELYDEEDIYFKTNTSGTLKFTSNNFCRLLKISCSEFEGQQYYDFINTTDLSDLISVHTKLVEEGKKIDAIGPYRMIQGNHEILVLLSAKPILDEEGNVEEIVYQIKDLTEQVESLNNSENKEEDKDWTKKLYPKIKNMDEESQSRLMVDKITYKED
mgnify:CR=1 FL=1